MSFSRISVSFLVVASLSGFLFAQKGPARLRVSPADQLIPPNNQLQFSAKELFFRGQGEPGGERDVTAQVIWTSSNTNIVTINRGSGLAQSTATQGTTMITARSGPYVATALLTVSSATLTSITVTPLTPSIPVGRHLQFVATGNYSDNSQHNLTSAATWSSGTSTTAVIDPLGFASSKGTGTTTISAMVGSQTGSTTLTVTAPVLDFIEITPGNPALIEPATQPLSCIGIYSDGTSQKLTASTSWSSSNSSVATISSAGVVSTVAFGTTVIQGTALGKTTTTSVSVIGLGVTSISNSSPLPLTTLQISTFMLNPNTPVTIQFSSTSGFTATEQPIRIASDGTIVAAVPLYVAPSTKQIGPGVVTMTLVQGGQTSNLTVLNIQDLPPLSAYGVSLGQVSHAFLIFEAMLHARRLNELQAVQLVQNQAIDTTAAQATMNTLLLASIQARFEVDSVMLNNSVVSSWGTLPDGTPLQFDKTQLDIMDRIYALYLTQQFADLGSSPPPGSPHARHFGKLQDTVNQQSLGSILTAALTMMQTHSGVVALIEHVQGNPNADDPTVAVIDAVQPVLEESGAEQLAGVTGLASGLAHFQAAVDSLFHDIGEVADCSASVGCTDARVQQIQSELNSTQADIVSAALQTYSQIPLIAGITEGVANGTLFSQAANAISTISKAGSTGQAQSTDTVDVSLASQEAGILNGNIGEFTGAVSITNNLGLASAQSGLDLCCVGGLQITGVADPGGNYDVYVPIGVPGTDYSNLLLSVVDPFTGNQLSSEFVDLTGVNANNPISVPPMSGVCNDSDAGTPDGDDPDCD